MAKKNMEKAEKEWIEHHELFIKMLPKKARDKLTPQLDELIQSQVDSAYRQHLIENLNDLRHEKPYNNYWPKWTKAICNITAGEATKIEIGQHNAKLIDKVKEYANLRSRRASIDFLINSFKPMIEPLLNSNDIEDLPDIINLYAYDTEATEDHISELQAEIKELKRQLTFLEDEVKICPDPTHGIDFDK